MNRALLWLVGGLVVLAVAVVAIAPELLADLGTAGSALGIALVALVPAALVAVLFVSTRRRHDRDRKPTTTTGADDGAPADDRTARDHDPTGDRGA